MWCKIQKYFTSDYKKQNFHECRSEKITNKPCCCSSENAFLYRTQILYCKWIQFRKEFSGWKGLHTSSSNIKHQLKIYKQPLYAATMIYHACISKLPAFKGRVKSFWLLKLWIWIILCFNFLFPVCIYIYIKYFTNKEHAFMIKYHVNISRINSSIIFIKRLSFIWFSIKPASK